MRANNDMKMDSPFNSVPLGLTLPMALLGGMYAGHRASNLDPRAILAIGGTIYITLRDIKLLPPTRALIYSVTFLGGAATALFFRHVSPRRMYNEMSSGDSPDLGNSGPTP